jgi:Fur family transcriptional regulator, peroxide stress response regulator
MKTASTMLKATDLAVTAQRAAVMKFLHGNTDHPSMDTIYKRVKKRFPFISRATVYNTVRVLTRAGLLQEVLVQQEKTRVDSNVSRHHHFKCMRCGRIEDVPYDILTAAHVSKHAKSYHIEEVRVVMEGRCKRCR